MISIKEQADYLYQGYGTNQNRKALRENFIQGANYVLGVFNDAAYKEDWITNPKDGIRRFFEIYRQLKK